MSPKKKWFDKAMRLIKGIQRCRGLESSAASLYLHTSHSGMHYPYPCLGAGNTSPLPLHTQLHFRPVIYHAICAQTRSHKEAFTPASYQCPETTAKKKGIKNRRNIWMLRFFVYLCTRNGTERPFECRKTLHSAGKHTRRRWCHSSVGRAKD